MAQALVIYVGLCMLFFNVMTTIGVIENQKSTEKDIEAIHQMFLQKPTTKSIKCD